MVLHYLRDVPRRPPVLQGDPKRPVAVVAKGFQTQSNCPMLKSIHTELTGPPPDRDRQQTEGNRTTEPGEADGAALDLLVGWSKALLSCGNASDLLHAACRILEQLGGYRNVWVERGAGVPEDLTGYAVQRVAAAAGAKEAGPVLSVDIKTQGRGFGVLYLTKEGRRGCDDREKELLDALGESLARSLLLLEQKARYDLLEEDLLWEVEVGSSIVELARTLILPNSIEDISTLVLKHAGDLTQSDFGYVGYLNPRTGDLICPQEEGSMEQSLFKDLWLWAWRNSRTLVVNAPEELPDDLAQPATREAFSCFLSVPAVIEGRTVGQIALCSRNRPHSERHLLLLRRLAILYAIAIQRKWMEEERERFTFLVEQSSDFIGILSLEGQVFYLNGAGRKLTGIHGKEEFDGICLADLLVQEDRDTGVAGFRKTLHTGSWEAEVLLRHFETHERIPVEMKGFVIRDPRTDDAVGVACFAKDIRERIRLESQLLHAQKMEAVGRLAGGIAHDFNNFLTGISGYTEFLSMGLGQDHRLFKYVRGIERAGDRAAALTRQLLAFSRRQVLQPKILDLNGIVEDMGKMLQRLIGEDVELVLALDPALGKVMFDPTQIEQVIMNLAVNARDAMPGGGKFKIETWNADGDGIDRLGFTGFAQGAFVVLSISDTGSGMDGETLSHVFEPFFTTKEKGKGTGLGLSTVYGIVEQSGGAIRVSSTPGCGTSFTICLPMARGKEEAPESAPGPVGSPRGRETVLVVEDDISLLNLVANILKKYGYKVLKASNGPQALEVHRDQKGALDLVLTDVVMPQMNGRELADTLRSIQPGLKVVYMSGYTDGAIARHGVLEPEVAFIYKPFKPEALARKVRDVLDASPRAADA